MRYRRLDINHDMEGLKGPGAHLEGADAVAAAVRSRLLSFWGEWWEDLEDGIPLEALIGRMDEEREQIADAMIRSRIMETEGVVGIDEYRVSVDGRKRVVHLTLVTEFGQSVVEVSV